MGIKTLTMNRTHPLLAYRIKHPIPPEEIRAGDRVVLKKWDTNPTYNAWGQHPRVRRARINYSCNRDTVKSLQRTPILVQEVYNGSNGCLYVDLASYEGKEPSRDDHGFRWFMCSDVIKVDA